ncbi:DUF397 domain-containing protein [Streptomyces sp. NPDC048436]|uniref:DUF397 domain-containing protein n=1 Tax=Streptomyces sp. NPDC048436 TaxID=3365550 RepID=UPI0037146121
MRKQDLYERDLSSASWHKSTRSQAIDGCVEVAELGGGAVAVRDSKNPDRGDLRFTEQEWAAFRGGVRDGEFD